MAFFFKQNLNNSFENFALALFSTHKFKKKKLKSVQFFFLEVYFKLWCSAIVFPIQMNHPCVIHISYAPGNNNDML